MAGKVKQAAGMILVSTGSPLELLLLKHADRWDLPKGHVDGNESLIETAYRETMEETGIPSEAIRLDASFRFSLEYTVQRAGRGEHLKKVTYFLGSVDREAPITLTEHVGYQWIPLPVLYSIQKQTIDPMLEQLQPHLGLVR